MNIQTQIKKYCYSYGYDISETLYLMYKNLKVKYQLFVYNYKVLKNVDRMKSIAILLPSSKVAPTFIHIYLLLLGNGTQRLKEKSENENKERQYILASHLNLNVQVFNSINLWVALGQT